MLCEYRPLKDSFALLGGFYHKSAWKTRRKFKVTDKQFSVLHQCYVHQVYANRLVTAHALRAHVPVNKHRIGYYLNVLHIKGYLIEVEPPTRRKVTQGRKRDVYYNVTELGETVIETFERLITEEIDRFKGSSKWKRINPNSLDYFENLGVLRSKPRNKS